MILEPFRPFLASEFRLKEAAEGWEYAGARALRRQVFCEEQRVFPTDDTDEIDRVARTLVALSYVGVAAADVVGTVRIHQPEPGLWWGSRLAVARPYRRHGALGAALIRLAVGTANREGAHRFLAHVQAPNVPLFVHLGWRPLGGEILHGLPHERMEADLGRFPPQAADGIGWYATVREAA